MRYLIKFSYDGTNYLGFQKQKNLNTIELALEKAATIINNGKKTSITATGRTDKKVHALCQYAHLDIDVEITAHKLKRAMNSNLPDDIYVIEAVKVKDDFHARYLVVEKTYEYYLNMGEYDPIKRNYVYQYNYQLDVESMKNAIKYFVGKHDFRAFVTENVDKENCIRDIYEAKIEENGYELCFVFRGNGFMRYQIRNMVGILLKVGQNKIEPTKVKEILDSKSRKENGVTAKPEGLYLKDVKYKDLEKYIIQ